MSYQEIYQGLSKKASNEQIKKLASLIKKAKPLFNTQAVNNLYAGGAAFTPNQEYNRPWYKGLTGSALHQVFARYNSAPGSKNSQPVLKGQPRAYYQQLASDNLAHRNNEVDDAVISNIPLIGKFLNRNK